MELVNFYNFRSLLTIIDARELQNVPGFYIQDRDRVHLRLLSKYICDICSEGL